MITTSRIRNRISPGYSLNYEYILIGCTVLSKLGWALDLSKLLNESSGVKLKQPEFKTSTQTAGTHSLPIRRVIRSAVETARVQYLNTDSRHSQSAIQSLKISLDSYGGDLGYPPPKLFQQTPSTSPTSKHWSTTTSKMELLVKEVLYIHRTPKELLLNRDKGWQIPESPDDVIRRRSSLPGTERARWKWRN